MAEAARKPPSERMYGKGPKIEPEPSKGDTNKSGHQAEAKKEAEKTAGQPESKANMKDGGDTKGDVMAGTEGIPTHHHEQARERTEVHHRHMAEHASMHERHEREHLMRVMGHHEEDQEAMHERHHGEARRMHTSHEREMRDMHERHEDGPSGGIKEKEIGKGGTEPK